MNLDDEDKKIFTCLPTCYAMFFAFNSKDAVESYCPFANHNKCWQETNSLESILDGYEYKNRSFKADELRQHVSQIIPNLGVAWGSSYFYMNFTQAS